MADCVTCGRCRHSHIVEKHPPTCGQADGARSLRDCRCSYSGGEASASTSDCWLKQSGRCARGRAAHLVLVTHQTAGKPSPHEIKAADRIEANLYQLGFPGDRFTIILTPNIHPITLTEASIVLKRLSAEGLVRSAVLMTDGFHERRSYLVYMQVGTPLGNKISHHQRLFLITAGELVGNSLDGDELFEESAKTYILLHARLSSFLLSASPWSIPLVLDKKRRSFRAASMTASA